MPFSLTSTNNKTAAPARSAATPAPNCTLSPETLASILGEIIHPFLVADSNGRLRLWNRALETLTGWNGAQLSRMTAIEFSAPGQITADQRLARKALETGQPQTRISAWRTRDQREIPVELHYSLRSESASTPLLLLQIGNLTERQQMEAELRQSQKMESIGRLAGGIAHDFNNVLTTILGLTEAMISGRTPPNAESLREIRHAAQHAAELTSQMLAFSRRQILEMRSLRLEAVAENLGKMVARMIGEDIHLEITPHGPLPAVRGDQSQIEQVLLNLCLNARDAMPKGGRLSIELRAEALKADWCAKHPGSRPGDYLALCVRDTGVGMDAETQARIFEPFYTRKAVGKGTGLGLSMVYGIVEQHDGFITVSSAPGKGSAFTIYFPATTGDPEKEAAWLEPPGSQRKTRAAVPAGSVQTRTAGAATILVVEDDKSVRSLFLDLLPKLGHRIYSAADGDEAIKVFERWASQIDLVLLDAVIPKTGSGEVYATIRRKKPGVRFLFTSGYNEVFINQKFELDPSFVFLRKPFNTEQLTEKIRAALS